MTPFATSTWVIAIPVAVVLILACLAALVFMRRSSAQEAASPAPVTPDPAPPVVAGDDAGVPAAAPVTSVTPVTPTMAQEADFAYPGPEPVRVREPEPEPAAPLETEGVGEGVSRVRDADAGAAVLAVIVESTVDVPDVRLTGVPTSVYFADDPDPEPAAGVPDLEALADVAKRRAVTVAGLERGQYQAFIGIATQLVLEGRVLERPHDAAHARRLLSEMSGAAHELHSAVAVVSERGLTTAGVTTVIELRHLSTDDIDRYIATGEWLGRQGAYDPRREGRYLISRVEGDIQNLRGWPYGAVMDAFSTHLSRDTASV